MNYPLFIARRLSLSAGGRRRAPAVSVAIAAVAISAAVMIATVSIVLGFKQEIRNKVVGFNGHISVYVSQSEYDDSNIVSLTPSLRHEISSLPFVDDISIQAAVPAILKTPDDFKGVYLKGLNGEKMYGFIERNLESGEIVDFSSPENANKVIISSNAARQLELGVGDKIDIYFITDDVRVRRLEIVGIFNTHFDQYDDVLVYGSLSLVQHLGGIGDDQGTYLQIYVDDFDKVSDYTVMLQSVLDKAVADGRLFRTYKTDNVMNQGAGYFSWLSLLDTNVIVVIILMMVVGCVTLVSGMLIIIIEKKRFVGMMKALGAPTEKVRKIFIYLALRIAVVGMLIGNLLMVSLLYLQDKTHFIPLDADSYYIDFIPVRLSPSYILTLNIGILVVIYFALILPSRFIAGISPADTMRYE